MTEQFDISASIKSLEREVDAISLQLRAVQHELDKLRKANAALRIGLAENAMGKLLP